MILYPLKFNSIYKHRIWGGDKLKTILHKKYTGENIGESWEISDVHNDETEVSDGDLKGFTLKQLIQKFKGDFLGQKVYDSFGKDFPLLIKFIDAKTPLSIQVHPNDSLAKERHNSFGKNEMWYVMQADDNAELIIGFNQEVEKDIFTKHLDNATLPDILNTEKVTTGDTFYIPTGRIHAIGSGVLLAEIQQTSDITYRIYDYDRVDIKTGKKRELHTDMALETIDYKKSDSYRTTYETKKNVSNRLVHTKYFKTNLILVNSKLTKDYTAIDSFVIYICVEGSLMLECNDKSYQLNKGETILIPAALNHLTLVSVSARVIEVTI